MYLLGEHSFQPWHWVDLNSLDNIVPNNLPQPTALHMRYAFLLLMLIATSAHSQPREEYFTIGDSKVATDRQMVSGSGWKIYDMDDGAVLSFEKSGSRMSLMKHRGVLFIASGCGFSPATGSVDERTMSMMIIQPPVVLMEEDVIHVECPAGAFIRLGRMVNP
jgi:hypothetical protein